MMKTFYTGLVLIAIQSIAFSQTVKFRKVIGNNGYDIGYSAQQTSDKGYIVGGATSSFGNGSSDMVAIKTDSFGVPVIQRALGGINIEKGLSIKQTTDKGYIFLGYTNSYGAGGYDLYLVKLDSALNTQWGKTYGGTDWDFGNCVKQTSDGGYILCGSTYSFGHGDQDYYLIKTNSNGDTLWTKTYGGANEDVARSVMQTSDGGYILTGTTKSRGDTDGDIYTIKTDPSGDTTWTNTFGGSLADYGNDIIQSISGGYIVAGETYSMGTATSSGIVVRISNSGIAVNAYAVSPGGSTNFNNFYSITEDLFGRVALVGSTTGSLSTDMWFFILNSDWSFFNASSFGTIKNDYGYSVGTTADRCWILCGSTSGFNNGLDDIYLIKTDTTGLSGFTGSETTNLVGISEQQPDRKISFRLFPNPANNNVTVLLSQEEINSEIIVSDVLGKEILHTHGASESTDLPVKMLTPGVYYITIKNNRNISTQKLIVTH